MTIKETKSLVIIKMIQRTTMNVSNPFPKQFKGKIIKIKRERSGRLETEIRENQE